MYIILIILQNADMSLISIRNVENKNRLFYNFLNIPK